MHFHTNGIESLYEHVPRDMLPTEYGGKAESLSVIKRKWYTILDKKRYFIDIIVQTICIHFLYRFREYLMDPDHWVIPKSEIKSSWLWW